MNDRIIIAPTPAPTPKLETKVGLDVRPLPALLRAPDTISRALGLDGSRAMSPEHLTRAAARRAGLPARFPVHVDEALEVMCRSIRDEARLHWFGRANLRNLIVTGLAELLLLDERFRAEPELDEQPLIPPLIVTGLPRSGTTFLHRLLSAPSERGGVPLHRHLFPTRRSELASRAEAELLFYPWKIASARYNLSAIHHVRPGLPDECNFGMRLALRSMIFWATAPTYGYLRWLLGQDLRETYKLYRRALLLHQARNPGRRLVLKCPHHLAWLPALREALPEAHIIQTHRSLTQIAPSEAKLVLSLQALSTHELDWRRTVAHNQLKLKTFAERSVEFADTEAGAAICHVDYRRLVREPIAVAREIHARFGIPHTAADDAALTQYFAANRQHKHGKNHYSLEMFELDGAAIEAQMRGYRDRFLAAPIDG
jgi:hypothetical protein